MITLKKVRMMVQVSEWEQRVKFKTQPFLPWHFNDCRNNLEELLCPSPIPGIRGREKSGEREKNERRTEKGCKVLRIAYILTP